jgi:phage-related protein (TIGR01555 family)
MSRKNRKKFENQSKIETTNSTILNSGLGEALFPAGFGYDNVAFGMQNVSKTGTLFSNLRGYPVSNMRQFLSQTYFEIALIQTVVNLPVDDALRGGINIISKQLDVDQIEELQNKIDYHDDLLAVREGEYWNRLYGGGGIITMTEQDQTEPLDIKKLTPDSMLEFKAADLWELFYDKTNVEGFNSAVTNPKFEYYSYYGNNLHKSRVEKLKGLTAPSFIRPRLRGWGFSVVEGVIRSINQYIKGTTLIFELLDEAKLDIFKLKNLAETLMQQNGASLVQQRVQLTNAQKSFQSAMVLDGDDTYEQKEFQFSGIADILEQIRIQVASDLRIPMTKLFGIQSSGFSDDEGSIENYISMVESTVRAKIKYPIIKILQLRCQQLFGFIPTDLKIEFQPLRIMKSTDEEAVKTAKFTRLQMSQAAGLITSEEFRDACNKANLLVVQLDNSASALKEIDSAIEEKTAMESGVDGANKSDTQSTKPKE